MKPGFILLEIIVAVALGSLISLGIFASFFQINRAHTMTDKRIDMDFRSSLVAHQLARDIGGAFVPYMLTVQKEKTITTTEITVTKNAKKETGKTVTKETDKILAPLPNAFYATVHDGNTSLLSLVTSNPLQIYGQIKPRVVRVIYRLVPERAGRGIVSFKLLRQERTELSFKGTKEGYESTAGTASTTGTASPAQEHELIGGINHMSISFLVNPVKKKEDKATKENDQKKDADTKKKEPIKKETDKEKENINTNPGC